MENLYTPGLGAALMSTTSLQEGVASLSRGAYFKEASLEMTLSVLTESAAQMSGVERVSIWALTDQHQELRCIELFERTSRRHSSGGAVRASAYPEYFRALHEEGTVVADDVYQHPATAAFAVDYLTKHQITAVLITPIHIRGELQGVLCLEQVGFPQPWTAAHQLFAQAVANLVTLALVEYEAEEARRQAQTASERLRAVFDASRDAMLLADGASGLILDANRQAEKLFGCHRRELLGRHQRTLHPPAWQNRMASEFRQLFEGRQSWALETEIQRNDGEVINVEISAEVADLSDGRRLALGIFRPI